MSRMCKNTYYFTVCCTITLSKIFFVVVNNTYIFTLLVQVLLKWIENKIKT